MSGSLVDRARARVGSTLREKWRLDALLGVGGMAAVYAATHRNGARAAIKVLHLALSLDPDVRQRFLREGYIANTVGHTGAVRVLDDDTAEDGCAFLVMELLDGESLESLSDRRGGKLPVAEVLVIAGKLLDVLAAAHEKGIVHRDIKPDNVFLTRDGGLKLLDFGIARIAGTTGAKQTAEGSAFGTPAYMSPEQALGRVREIDARTDIWSVGASMFTLIAGREVHQADTITALLVAHASQQAQPLMYVAPHCPREVASIVDCALQFDKAQRWPSAAAMRNAIIAAQGRLGLPTLAPSMTLSQGQAPAQPQQTAPAISAPQGATVAPSVTAVPRVPRVQSGRSGVIIGTIAGVLFMAGAIAIYRATIGGSRAPASGAASSAPVVDTPSATPSAPVVTPAPEPTATAEPASTTTAAPSAAPSATASHGPRTKPRAPDGAAPRKPAGKPDDSWLDRQH